MTARLPYVTTLLSGEVICDSCGEVTRPRLEKTNWHDTKSFWACEFCNTELIDYDPSDERGLP
jgi:hypothetical protein